MPWTFLLALALLVDSTQNGYGDFAPPNPSQTAFVPLLQWAKANNFKLAWAGKDDSVSLTNESFKLSFKADSTLAQINGVSVWLGQPVTPKNGRVCIDSLDLNNSIEPILFPHTNQAHATIRTICLDPGHGHQDTGGIFGRYVEKQYTLPLAEALAGQLKAAGFRVILTRTNDTFVQLADRPALANRQKADLFISLHFNIGPPGEAKGVEVYCLTPAKAKSTNAGRWGDISEWRDDTGPVCGNRCDDWNIALAYQLEKSLVKNLSAEDRGVRRARFAVLRTAEMPAVLIEGGFLSDPVEQKKIADPKYRAQVAAAIVQGVLNYQSIFEDRQSTRNQHEITKHRRQTGA
ncbi:MAG TPA: N-acetylmuramoyl-L-alanine amidase [Candidatus Acidoferrales bacterium]|nr:N-acetylmuramoyl-L-alanine amidase [Candidatus Acidoferrales bacterium]